MSHVILRCRLADAVWDKLGLKEIAVSSDGIPHFFKAEQPGAIHGKLWHILFAACATILWNARNAQVFRNELWRPRQVFHEVAELLTLSTARAGEDDTRAIMRAWANLFTSD